VIALVVTASPFLWDKFHMDRQFSCLQGVSFAAKGDTLMVSNHGNVDLTGINIVVTGEAKLVVDDLDSKASGYGLVFRYGESLGRGGSMAVGSESWVIGQGDGTFYSLHRYRPSGVSLHADQGAYSIGNATWCRAGESVGDSLWRSFKEG